MTDDFVTIMNERETYSFLRDEESEVFRLDSEEIVVTSEGI